MSSPTTDALDAPFEPLARRILAEATVVDDRILKIDHFLNHRVEPAFMAELGRAMAARLARFEPDTVLTAEASGIAPGLAVATALDVPLVFAKKYAPVVELPAYSRVVPSATKGGTYRLVVASRFLGAGQRVVLVDDFLANGNTALALAEIVAEAGAHMLAAGFLVEKRFQHGRAPLVQRGIPIATLVQIERLAQGRVVIAGVAE